MPSEASVDSLHSVQPISVQMDLQLLVEKVEEQLELELVLELVQNSHKANFQKITLLRGFHMVAELPQLWGEFLFQPREWF